MPFFAANRTHSNMFPVMRPPAVGKPTICGKPFTSCSINELAAEILHLFVERVETGEREEKWSHNAPQEINIYYRDTA